MTIARRIADALIYLAVAGFVILGLIQVAILPLTGTEATKYAAAGSCPLTRAITTDACVAYLNVTFISEKPAQEGNGLYAPSLTVRSPLFAPQTQTFLVSRPSKPFYSLRRGDTVELKVWNGRPTALSQPRAASRLEGNPYDNDELRSVGGISVLAMGLVLLLVHPPQVVRRKLATMRLEAPETRRAWTFQEGLVAAVTRDVQMRIAVGVFVVAQGLDVITSIRGGQVQLFEGNPVVAALIKGTGPVIAFVLVKVLAVIALLLVMARLPRRAALFVVLTTSIVFLYVAYHNAQLIASTRLKG